MNNNTIKKIMLRYKTDRTWFSHLSGHPARKQSWSIVTTTEHAQGQTYDSTPFHDIAQSTTNPSPISPAHLIV